MLTRYPDGIAGKSFFQKDAPDFAPDWIRLERIWSEHAEREIDYFVCDDVETLLYVANLGSIPLHVWASRVAALERPDWCILDLDPKGAPFAHVVELALAIHALCDEIGLPDFIKTSGATGLHVLMPLGGQCTYAESRTLGEILARVDRAGPREDRDDRAHARIARRQGLRRLPPERPRQDDRRSLLGAARSRRDLLRAAPLDARSTRSSIRSTSRSGPCRRG